MQRFILLISLLIAGPALADRADWEVLEEMHEPEGIEFAPRRDRAPLQVSIESTRALTALEEALSADWRALRELPWHDLSTHQIDRTRLWEPPQAFEATDGNVLARDSAGLLHLEIRGPRIPARYDIIYRYVHAFAVFDPVRNELSNLQITIRGWVEE